MLDRYPDTAGCRLDDGTNRPRGQALDLHGRLSTKIPQPTLATLWVRDESDKEVTIELNFRDVQALRDGCTRMLQEAGVEKSITVSVPSRP